MCTCNGKRELCELRVKGIALDTAIPWASDHITGQVGRSGTLPLSLDLAGDTRKLRVPVDVYTCRGSAPNQYKQGVTMTATPNRHLFSRPAEGLR